MCRGARVGAIPLPNKISHTDVLERTTLDPNPKVAGRPIDLENLYAHVKNLGGYDVISAKKKGWREVALVFGIGNANAAAYAHALKTLYYKNLA